MKKYYFVFCKSDIMLQRLHDGSYTIPCCEEPPTEIKPWTWLMNITPLNGHEVITYRIDSPVTASPIYEMCGLRPSWYELSK